MSPNRGMELPAELWNLVSVHLRPEDLLNLSQVRLDFCIDLLR